MKQPTNVLWKAILIVAFLPAIIELVLKLARELQAPILIIMGLLIIYRLCLFGWRRHQRW